MGVWGIETDFGAFAGGDSVIRSLTSLAFAHYHEDYFRAELIAALQILEEGDISRRGACWAPGPARWARRSSCRRASSNMPSISTAGANATSGRNSADAIGSTANYLKEHGWKPGLPWGFEVTLPDGFALTAADSRKPAPFASFAKRGVKRADGKPLPDPGEGQLMILAGLNGPVFLVTSNFLVIKSYNNSTSYALAVALLGDEILGGEGVQRRLAGQGPPARGGGSQGFAEGADAARFRCRRYRRPSRRGAALGGAGISGKGRLAAGRLRDAGAVEASEGGGMMTPNPTKADSFFLDATAWREEFTALRKIVRECPLDEALKWGQPCYASEGRNIVLIHGFKDYCAVLFFKGALLNDPDGALIQQTANVQAGRQMRFKSMKDVNAGKDVLKSLVLQAIEVEKAGLKVAFKTTTEFSMAEEFQARLDADPALKTAFDALTPGRQKAYLLHFSQPKQAKTRQARVEKAAPAILAGKGLND